MGTGVRLVAMRPEVSRLVLGAAASLGVTVEDGAEPRGPVGGSRLVLVDVGRPPAEPLIAEASPWQAAGVAVLGVHLAGEAELAQRTAGVIGASVVVELPTGESGLRRLLGPDSQSAPSLAVVGAVGGAGATTVAIACAAAAPDALLVDADPWSAGMDLPLGIGPERGGRWSAIPDTTEPLVAQTLRTVLPGVQGITVLTGPAPTPAGARLAAAVAVGRTGFGSLVLDCGRSPSGVPLTTGDPVVIVTPATIAGVVGSRRLLESLDVGARAVLAVRSGGYLPIEELAEHLGVGAVLEVPRVARLPESLECGEVLAGRVGRDLAAIGERLWRAVG